MSDAAAEGLTRGQVRMAYRLILGREPENVRVLDRHIARHANLASLRAAFMNSAEYLAQFAPEQLRFRTVVRKGYVAPAQTVEHIVSAEVRERLAARIREQWTKLGESEPYWSVLTDERYRAATIDEGAREQFHRSGAHSAALIDLFAARTGLAVPTGTCVELGCGVGRITRHLSERFERVIAIDISPGNLALCRQHLADEGITNVETLLIREIEELSALPPIDHFFSMIVLQHNPPPIQFRLLEILLGKLTPGGQCLFQTVADLPGYEFEAETYLATPSPEMEIHALPMAVIAALMRRLGVALDLARMDVWVEAYGSYTFAGHRET